MGVQCPDQNVPASVSSFRADSHYMGDLLLCGSLILDGACFSGAVSAGNHLTPGSLGSTDWQGKSYGVSCMFLSTMHSSSL